MHGHGAGRTHGLGRDGCQGLRQRGQAQRRQGPAVQVAAEHRRDGRHQGGAVGTAGQLAAHVAAADAAQAADLETVAVKAGAVKAAGEERLCEV